MTEWNRNCGARAMMLAVLLLTVAPHATRAQEEEEGGWAFGVAGEVVSQFVWRGLLLHDKPSIQPDVFLSGGSLSIGFWSSWPVEGDVNEMDFYVAWFKEVAAGELGITLTDYFYPYEGGDFTDFGGAQDGESGGAHTVELGVEFSPAALPLTFSLGWNVHNDPDRSLYGAVSSGLPFASFVDLEAEAGFLLKDSPYYYETEAGLLHYGLTASRGFALGALEPYLSVGFVRNHVTEENLWVFAIGF